MSGAAPLPLDRLRSTIMRDGFAFVRAEAMREALARSGSLSDWDALAASWDDLGPDSYEADLGRVRQRRHAVYAAKPGGSIERMPNQPHYQARDYNPVHGGIERWFEPIRPEIGDSPSMRTILGFCRRLFDGLARGKPSWHIELHQFRIEARPGKAGRPTPEGPHRDGVDYVLVLLIRRRNVVSGTTSIHAADDGSMLGSFTLTDPFDAALVDDARVCHGVTPVEPLDPGAPAYRDVLVVTFRKG